MGAMETAPESTADNNLDCVIAEVSDDGSDPNDQYLLDDAPVPCAPQKSEPGRCMFRMLE